MVEGVSLCALLRKQIERTQPDEDSPAPNRVIAACGGLSRNNYVFWCLKRFIEESFGTDGVEVIRPLRPWPAIAEGAVLSAMGKSPVVSRVSRDHILVRCHRKYDARVHQPSDRFYCPHLGPRANNQLDRIVKRGEKLTPSKRNVLKGYHVVENPRAAIKSATIRQDIYRSSSDSAPNRADDPAVVLLGTIDVNITKLAREKRAKLRKVTGDYPPYMNFDVDIELTMSSTKGVLEAVAKSENKKVGHTTIHYAAAPAWDSNLVHQDDDDSDVLEEVAGDEGDEGDEEDQDNSEDEEDDE